MAQTIDLTGQRIGRLQVVERNGSIGRDAAWACQCDCGRTVTLRGNSLRRGTLSCGCLRRENIGAVNRAHGMCQTREYTIWNSMVHRCRDKSAASYRYYGARGIRVAPEWLGRGGFTRFWAYAGPTYQAGLSLDRIDPNGHYEPGNIRWIPLKDQAVTRRRTNWIETPKGRMCVTHAAKVFNIARSTLRRRLAANEPWLDAG